MFGKSLVYMLTVSLVVRHRNEKYSLVILYGTQFALCLGFPPMSTWHLATTPFASLPSAPGMYSPAFISHVVGPTRALVVGDLHFSTYVPM